jgi:hypothetical protein
MLFNICWIASFKTKSTSTFQGLEKIQKYSKIQNNSKEQKFLEVGLNLQAKASSKEW